MRTLIFALAAAGALASSMPALAQGACTLSPAQVAANKTAALAFFRPGITPDERIALLDPSYVQHNPRFKQFAQDNHVSDYEGFKTMVGQLRAGAPAGAAPPAQPAPAPPPGDPQAVVMADCDLVTVLHKNMRPDPAKPGAWYEAFTFDTFRVKNGKLVEHWDDAVIPPPAPPRG